MFVFPSKGKKLYAKLIRNKFRYHDENKQMKTSVDSSGNTSAKSAICGGESFNKQSSKN